MGKAGPPGMNPPERGGGSDERANNRNPGTTAGQSGAGESAIEDGATKQDS